MHSQVEYIVAHGIVSEVNGRKVIIGSAHFVFEDAHCAIPEGEQGYDSLPDQYSHLYLAVGGVLSAVVCISAPLRPEAEAVIRQLRGSRYFFRLWNEALIFSKVSSLRSCSTLQASAAPVSGETPS